MSKATREYGLTLTDSMYELCITKQMLEAETGISYDTITRYKEGANENFNDADNMEKIREFLDRKSVFHEFSHMPAEDFLLLFRECWDLLKSSVTQDELAGRIHWNQSQVSKFAGREPGNAMPVSTEDEYTILSALLELVSQYRLMQTDSVLLKAFSEQEYKLREILKQENEDSQMTSEGFALFWNAIDSFDAAALQVIASAPLAFFDSIGMLRPQSGKHCYFSAYRLFRRLSALPAHRMSAFSDELEDLIHRLHVNSYRNNENQWQMFGLMDQYWIMMRRSNAGVSAPLPESRYRFLTPVPHKIVLSTEDAPRRGRKTDPMKTIRETAARLEFPFKYMCSEKEYRDYVDMVTDDLEFRLTMSPFQWNIWSMYASVVYMLGKDDLIQELINKQYAPGAFQKIDRYLASLPDSQSALLRKYPMAFFDSLWLASQTWSRSFWGYNILSAREILEEYQDLSDAQQAIFRHNLQSACRYINLMPVRLQMQYVDCYAASCSGGGEILDDLIGISKADPREVLFHDRYDGSRFFYRFQHLFAQDDPQKYGKLADDLIEEIQFRLTMTPEQWRIWLLLMSTLLGFTGFEQEQADYPGAEPSDLPESMLMPYIMGPDGELILDILNYPLEMLALARRGVEGQLAPLSGYRSITGQQLMQLLEEL